MPATTDNQVRLTCAPDEVHVWSARLDVGAEVRCGLAAALSTEERERAARYRFDADRARFVVRRGLLRLLLAAYLGTGPQAVALRLGPHGRPELGRRSSLRFNVASSGDLALIAVGRGRQVGVDLEGWRPGLEAAELADLCLSPTQACQLRALPPALGRRAFLAGWVQKEAYLKARGLGLSAPLNSFDVVLDPTAQAALLRHHLDPTEVGRWSLQFLPVEPPYVAALAVEGHGWRLVAHEWDELKVQLIVAGNADRRGPVLDSGSGVPALVREQPQDSDRCGGSSR